MPHGHRDGRSDGNRAGRAQRRAATTAQGTADAALRQADLHRVPFGALAGAGDDDGADVDGASPGVAAASSGGRFGAQYSGDGLPAERSGTDRAVQNDVSIVL